MNFQSSSDLERKLIHKLKSKDQHALRYLYTAYRKALYKVIFKIVKIPCLTEEVLQDTFVRIWYSIHTYDPEKGKIFTWMRCIAKNLAIDKIRSQEYTIIFKTQNCDNIEEMERKNEYVEMKNGDFALVNLLHHLDDNCRKIIYLVYFEGYSHAQIAKEHGIPLGTVKTRVRNALIQLRLVLNIVPTPTM